MTAIHRAVFAWYQKNKRNLPWRKIRDPYKILVSEVMLQQTQVERVIPKYREFLQQFPTVHALAHAKTAEVIRAWKGLGYNRRALFLQKIAQITVREYGGKFSKDISLLKKLPGVGEYTARAILAFAYGEPIAVLDTNHRRFYQRVFFGLKKKTDKALIAHAEGVLPRKRPYDWNQALMDFGSLVCLTGRPKCEICPIGKYCLAYPDILNSKQKISKNKPSVPFRETDRYFRGRMIDMLREEAAVSMQKMRHRFPELSQARFEKILVNLEKDGLIVKGSGCILLP